MSWQLLLAISIVFTSLNGLIHRTIMKSEQSSPMVQTIVFSSLTGTFALIIALIRGFHFPEFPLLLPNFLLMVLLSTLAPLSTFKSYKFSEASEVGIILSSQRLWIVILAFIFLEEIATWSKISGTILILIGIGVILWRKHKFRFTKGMFFALLAAFFYGVSFVNAFYILRSLDAPSFEVYATLLPALTLVIIRPQAIRKMKFYLSSGNGVKLVSVAIFDLLATLSLYFAYQVGRNASQIAPLSSTYLVLTVTLAAIFLKERENLIKKLVGAVIVIIGSVLII